MARFDSVLSFSHDPLTNDQEPHAAAYDNGASDDDDAGFEFTFAPPLATEERDAQDTLAPADDLFAHGRILPAYPVFHRRFSLRGDAAGQDDLTPPQVASTAPPSPDSYCAWAPRSAPGSPAREFPKSASTGEARRFWRLRDLVGGRSHSDGKEKFVFLQAGNSSSAAAPSEVSKAAAEGKFKQAKKPSAEPPQPQKQSKKKGAVTEMDMATAHKLFYGKQAAGGDRKQNSYLPYRTGIVGFFANAHALGRSHHPY